MENTPLVIGITGQPSSGKDTVAAHLVGKGFQHFSGGDILREEMKQLGLPLDREQVREFSAKMRETHGNAYLTKKIIRHISKNAVISGFRNVAGVETFRKHFPRTFALVAVDAPVEVRYRRARSRGRIGDDISFEQFQEEENQERVSPSGSHEVDKVIALADYHIQNTGTQEELFQKIDAVLAQIMQ